MTQIMNESKHTSKLLFFSQKQSEDIGSISSDKVDSYQTFSDVEFNLTIKLEIRLTYLKFKICWKVRFYYLY